MRKLLKALWIKLREEIFRQGSNLALLKATKRILGEGVKLVKTEGTNSFVGNKSELTRREVAYLTR